MKRLTATYIIDFPDDTPDETCYQVANEVIAQDNYWLGSNSRVKIETVPDGTPNPTEEV